MKNVCSIFGLLALILLGFNTVLAVKPIKSESIKQEARQGLTKKETKKLDKFEKKVAKRMEKMNTKLNSDVDFDDPVDKWLWFSIFGFGLGLVSILLGILVLSGFFGFLAGLLILFAFVSIIVWLVKTFS